MDTYTPEQIKDITDREQKGLELLKNLELTPAAVIQKVSIGNDSFADQVIPYLKDTHYDKPVEQA